MYIFHRAHELLTGQSSEEYHAPSAEGKFKNQYTTMEWLPKYDPSTNMLGSIAIKPEDLAKDNDFLWKLYGVSDPQEVMRRAELINRINEAMHKEWENKDHVMEIFAGGVALDAMQNFESGSMLAADIRRGLERAMTRFRQFGMGDYQLLSEAGMIEMAELSTGADLVVTNEMRAIAARTSMMEEIGEQFARNQFADVQVHKNIVEAFSETFEKEFGIRFNDPVVARDSILLDSETLTAEQADEFTTAYARWVGGGNAADDAALLSSTSSRFDSAANYAGSRTLTVVDEAGVAALPSSTSSVASTLSKVGKYARLGMRVLGPALEVAGAALIIYDIVTQTKETKKATDEINNRLKENPVLAQMFAWWDGHHADINKRLPKDKKLRGNAVNEFRTDPFGGGVSVVKPLSLPQRFNAFAQDVNDGKMDEAGFKVVHMTNLIPMGVYDKSDPRYKHLTFMLGTDQVVGPEQMEDMEKHITEYEELSLEAKTLVDSNLIRLLETPDDDMSDVDMEEDLFSNDTSDNNTPPPPTGQQPRPPPPPQEPEEDRDMNPPRGDNTEPDGSGGTGVAVYSPPNYTGEEQSQRVIARISETIEDTTEHGFDRLKMIDNLTELRQELKNGATRNWNTATAWNVTASTMRSVDAQLDRAVGSLKMGGTRENRYASRQTVEGFKDIVSMLQDLGHETPDHINESIRQFAETLEADPATGMTPEQEMTNRLQAIQKMQTAQRLNAAERAHQLVDPLVNRPMSKQMINKMNPTSAHFPIGIYRNGYFPLDRRY